MLDGYVSRDAVIQGVSIIEIAEEFGLDIEEISSGNFDYRCKCPSMDHKNGAERTNSLYIDSQNNSFHCFGCNAGNNCIDFYMICSGESFSAALSKLKGRVDPEKQSLPAVIKESNFYILLESSNILRKAMLEHVADLKWINSLMKAYDSKISKLDPYDVKSAKKILESIKEHLKKRYSK